MTPWSIGGRTLRVRRPVSAEFDRRPVGQERLVGRLHRTRARIAEGAARQAAWALSGASQPPDWVRPGLEWYEAEPVPGLRERYAQARDHVLPIIREA